MRIPFLIATLGLLAACSKGPKPQDPDGSETTSAGEVSARGQPPASIVSLTPEQARNAGVATGKAQLGNISSSLKVSGAIEVPPENMVAVSLPLGGYLASNRLLPGMTVRKGQVLAVVEDQQYIQLQQDYLTAKARLGFLEKEYDRQRELNQDKASSDKQFQQTEADYRTQQAVAQGLAERLRLINIDPDRLEASAISRSINVLAPISGFISRVNVSVGKYVTPSEPLFEIINSSNLHLTLKVFEKDLSKLQVGQQVLAYSNSDPAKKYACRVNIITRDISTERNAEVHCHFKSWDKQLVPGMFMNAEIEQSKTEAYTLPDEAVVSYEQKNYAFVVKGDNQFALTQVQSGVVQEGRVEIKSTDGVDLTGASFVTKGAYTLLMKLKNTSDDE